ncbi:tRNA-splicing endonuclease subunit Sen2-like, partial [Plectropomus leopardus]|uniref:tRNA-splicing endonuclease subunit Sen2-like n=1 Tax=Plectropomus leopardus TaxID=160734 RepID=UPI001C4C55F7
MQAEFRAPRRRTQVQEEFEAPLPVRSHFRAQLINQHVLVCDPDHIQEIHNQGYFGKGILSRSRPDHNISDQWEEHQGLVLPVISQSRFEELLRWAGSALSAQGLDEEAVSQTLLRLCQPIDVEAVRREVEGAGGWTCGEEVRRRCRGETRELSLDHHPDPDPGPGPDPDSGPNPDSGPDPLVPGPDFVLVVSDSEVSLTETHP